MSDLLQATGGSLLSGDPSLSVTSYSIDSRTLTAGGAFYALPGTHVDGHTFVGEAARAGALVAIVARRPSGDGPYPAAMIQVDDVAAALARCGALARQHIRGKVVAITGSAGKTTTKNLVAAALGASLKVYRTTGNLNNELGVPLSLLACPADVGAAVFELGMNGPGQIAFLARLADPDVALVTNVLPVHLEFFESLDDIAAAKGEIYAVLREHATSVVNLDDVNVRVQAARHAGPRVTFGSTDSADLKLESLVDRFDPGAELSFRHAAHTHTVTLKIGGAHAAKDALAAAAAVVAFGAPLGPALEAMANVEPAPGRGRLTRLPDGVVVVDDTYNSNPEALASVIGTLKSSTPAGRRVLVMGDMLELGPRSAAFHQEAGELAARSGIALLVGVGPLSRHAVDAARRAGIEARAEVDAIQAAQALTGLLRAGDLAVIKGSRGMKLEAVVEAIAARRGEGA